MKITITGVEEVKSRLTRLADVPWSDIQEDEAREMKAKSDTVTPVDTGALRSSATYDDGEFGYTVDYAPHVNYGHRTRSGSFVPGQHFLEEVVNGQDEKYKQEVLQHLREDK